MHVPRKPKVADGCPPQVSAIAARAGPGVRAGAGGSAELAERGVCVLAAGTVLELCSWEC